jgi:hypothetical protein
MIMPEEDEEMSHSPEASRSASGEDAAEPRQLGPRPVQSDRRDGAPRGLDAWHDLVDQRILDAMDQGTFTNLPGAGRPLDFRPDPFVPDDQRTAYKLMQDNDMAPAWIDERRAVQDSIERLRRDIQEMAGWHLAELAGVMDRADRARVCRRWRWYVERWEDQIGALNRRIQTLNLQQPVLQLEIFKLRLDEELVQAGVHRTLEG